MSIRFISGEAKYDCRNVQPTIYGSYWLESNLTGRFMAGVVKQGLSNPLEVSKEFQGIDDSQGFEMGLVCKLHGAKF